MAHFISGRLFVYCQQGQKLKYKVRSENGGDLSRIVRWTDLNQVKPNQVGTISETIEVLKIARQAGWKVVVSHRSGETNDDFIADFAVGVGADYVKFGAPARGERVVKYNRLLAIEEELSKGKQE